jgi:hypothetical protein
MMGGNLFVGLCEGRVPILIPSRADKAEAKLLSIALGVIMSEYYSKNSERSFLLTRRQDFRNGYK